MDSNVYILLNKTSAADMEADTQTNSIPPSTNSANNQLLPSSTEFPAKPLISTTTSARNSDTISPSSTTANSQKTI